MIPVRLRDMGGQLIPEVDEGDQGLCEHCPAIATVCLDDREWLCWSHYCIATDWHYWHYWPI